jgi:quinol monooxygenase YgiN
MMSEQVTVIAEMRVRPGSERHVLDGLPDLVANSRAEPGCITFVAHQSPDDASVFKFFEVFADDRAFAVHKESRHVSDFLKLQDAHGAQPLEVTLWKKLSI